MKSAAENKKSNNNRHTPKGIKILFEDRDILVVDKENGLLTIGTEREKNKTAHFMLNEYVKKGNNKSPNRIYIVHRLDRDTSGILVFAKTEKVKTFLQENWQSFQKKYTAVVYGHLTEKTGVISSYLAENKIHRMYSVKNPALGKYAETGYSVIKESKLYSLLDINLLTGRKNQIRVHFAEKGHPVVGDKMYGTKEPGIKRLLLHASSISLTHPFTKKEMTFEAETPGYFNVFVK